MATQFGSGIDASLARADPSAILQGGVSGAQSIGRGIEQFGAAVGNVLERRGAVKEKQENEAKQLQQLQEFFGTAEGGKVADQLGLPENFGESITDLESTNRILEFAQQGANLQGTRARTELTGLQLDEATTSAEAKKLERERSAAIGADLEALNRLDAGATDVSGDEMNRLLEFQRSVPGIEKFQSAKRAGVSDAALAKTMQDSLLSELDPTEALEREKLIQANRKATTDADKSATDAALAHHELEFAGSPEAAQTAATKRDQAIANLAKTKGEVDKASKLDAEGLKQAENKLVRTVVQFETLSTFIDEAINLTTKSGIIGAAGMFSPLAKFAPGSDAAQLGETLRRIQSDSAFSALIELKDAGGNLGQIAVAELEALRDSVVPLGQSQKPKELAKNLKLYKKVRRKALQRIAVAYKEQFGKLPEGFPEQFLSDEAAEPAAPAVLDGNTITADTELTPGQAVQIGDQQVSIVSKNADGSFEVKLASGETVTADLQ